MKKLLKHLQSIDPRITVKVYIVEEQYVLEAGIEGSFCGQVINKSFRKAKKKFFKEDSIIEIMKEVEVLHQYEAKKEAERESRIKEQVDLLAKEFEELYQDSIDTAEFEELGGLFGYINEHNAIRDAIEKIGSIKC